MLLYARAPPETKIIYAAFLSVNHGTTYVSRSKSEDPLQFWRSVLQLDRLSWLKMSDSLIVDDAIMKTDD